MNDEYEVIATDQIVPTPFLEFKDWHRINFDTWAWDEIARSLFFPAETDEYMAVVA